MSFNKLKLHTQLLIIVISVWLLVVISVFATSHFFVGNLNDQLQRDFYNEVNRNLNSTILSNSNRLGSLVMSHSYWTELQDAAKIADSDWIKANATEYLLKDSGYQVDIIYLYDQKSKYMEHYGVLSETIIKEVRALVSDKELATQSTAFLIRDNQKLYLVALSGLTDTNHQNLSGFLLFGQEITADINDLLVTHYSDRAVVKMNTDHWNGYSHIRISPELLPGFIKTQMQLDISDIVLTKTINTHSSNLLNAVFGTLLFSAFILLMTLFRISGNFEESIHRIKMITYHDYSQKIDLDFSKDFSELSQCINNLSSELSKRDLDINNRYIELISILIKTLEEVDFYTKGHSERVSHYSVALAKAYGLKDEDLETIRLSGLLHDIGKITVSTKILNKPGKLDFEEFEAIKKHPLTAYNILGVSDVFKPIKEIVKGHHEKVDGTGYPEGLVGDRIALGARIVAIADVFDSLTSERSYRQPMPLDEALGIIENDAGTHFDAELVACFMTIAETTYQTWSKLQDTPEVEELYLTQ